MHRLLELLDTAVQKDVFSVDPRDVAVNVSGGLDSSTVCALAKKWNPRILTFTGYYDVPGYDERWYARMVAAGTSHYEVPITARDFVENFDRMMQHFTPPFQGPGMFGQYMVAKFISKFPGVSVVLSGEGSDELFGGYARLMAVAGEPMPDGYENYTPPTDYPTSLKEALAYDYARLPDLLKVDDEALGAFGLQARAPFTDKAVAWHGLSLPPASRVGKTYLRRAVRGLVPDPIIDRTDKKGFPVPLVTWANEVGNPVREFVKDRIGYVPNPELPFDRKWWLDMCESWSPIAAAA